MSSPNKQLWTVGAHYRKYDACVFSAKDNQQDLETPQVSSCLASIRFPIKNRQLSDKEIEELWNIMAFLRLAAGGPNCSLDRWKDPRGVIEAFKIAQKEIKATLVLLGNFADDDP